MKHKFGLVPEPLSEEGKEISELLKKHDLNPSCASRALIDFSLDLEAKGLRFPDNDLKKVFQEIRKYWEAQRKGHAGHIVEK